MGLLFWLVLAFVVWVVIPSIREKQRREQEAAMEGAARKDIVRGIAGMLAKIAKADGHVSAEEVGVAQTFLRSMGLSAADYRLGVATFNSAKDDYHSIDDYAMIFARVASPEACQLVYEVMWSVAAADGVIHPNEDRLLRQVLFRLRLSDAHYLYCRRRYVSSSGGPYGYGQPEAPRESELDRAYRVLGCSRNDSFETVKAAYRKQAMKYHPDRLRAEGLPEGLIEKATKTMAEINEAWDLIRKSRS